MRTVTLDNATNSEMSDIRTIQKVCNISLEEALEHYNESFKINPYDLEEAEDEPELFGPEDNYVEQ